MDNVQLDVDIFLGPKYVNERVYWAGETRYTVGQSHGAEGRGMLRKDGRTADEWARCFVAA